MLFYTLKIWLLGHNTSVSRLKCQSLSGQSSLEAFRQHRLQVDRFQKFYGWNKDMMMVELYFSLPQSNHCFILLEWYKFQFQTLWKITPGTPFILLLYTADSRSYPDLFSMPHFFHYVHNYLWLQKSMSHHCVELLSIPSDGFFSAGVSCIGSLWFWQQLPLWPWPCDALVRQWYFQFPKSSEVSSGKLWSIVWVDPVKLSLTLFYCCHCCEVWQNINLPEIWVMIS